MANKVIVTKSKLNTIGDTIREKTGENERYTLDEMPDAIRSISGNGDGESMTSNFYIPIFGVKVGIVAGTIEYNS